MIFYPFYKELQDFADNNKFSNGNFGLWYNKLIPNLGQNGENKWSLCDKNGNKDGKTQFYKNAYLLIKDSKKLFKLLEKKHWHQMHYLQSMEKQNFNCITFTGTLKSSLITGLGETHPSEASIVLDHTLGIPYLPASGIKGVVRYSHSKQLLFDNDGKFREDFVIDKNEDGEWKQDLDETNEETRIPLFFGGDLEQASSTKSVDTLKGSITFLDAYPLTPPEIKTDIINPHYPKYYNDDNKPPGDYQDPVPVKFLTIVPETQFMFRFILNPEASKHKKQFINAIKDALENEGFGAKTAIGYGQFRLSETVPTRLKTSFEEYIGSTLTDEDKFIRKVNLLEKANESQTASSNVDSLFTIWRNTEKLKDNIKIAEAFKAKIKRKKAKGFTKSYETVCKILGKKPDAESKPEGSLPQKSEKKPDGSKKAIEKLESFINKGFCSKKDRKKLMDKYKKDYPDLCSKIKRLPNKQ